MIIVKCEECGFDNPLSGPWPQGKDYHYRCIHCRRRIVANEAFLKRVYRETLEWWRDKKRGKGNTCPHCGRKLRETEAGRFCYPCQYYKRR